ncbi:MAG: IclR family transcriptional regulator [Ardenticatenaceae bacterium]|nr:IclR family transcriptional regulator [Ardenticatenaceae bacterium]
MEDSYKYISQSIQRALDVLFAFTVDRPELSITELSELFDLPKSTVHRLIANLEMRGLVEQNQATGRYRLGIKTFELGMRMRRQLDLIATVHPFLEDLASKTGETVMLATLSDGDVVYLDKVDSQRSVRAASVVGQRRPVHCTALGKVFLSSLPAHEVSRILGQRPLTARTSNTITEPERLFREIAIVREQGYALDNQEFEVDLCCVAAPITNETGTVIAGVGIAAPVSRVNATTLDALIQQTQATAREISEQFRYLTHAALAIGK